MTSRWTYRVGMFLTALAVSFGAITEARAGDITAAEIVKGCGTITLHGGPLDISKEFDRICSMDILFTVTNNPDPGVDLGTNAFKEDVFNRTNITWSDFHMQLGFGFGTGFTPIDPTCGTGFATLPQPGSDTFTPRGVSSNNIDWDGDLEHFRTARFNFTFSVLDSSPCIPAGSMLPGGYTFTLRQTPTTTPEPATILLLVTGIAGVGLRARHNRRRKK